MSNIKDYIDEFLPEAEEWQRATLVLEFLKRDKKIKELSLEVQKLKSVMSETQLWNMYNQESDDAFQ